MKLLKSLVLTASLTTLLAANPLYAKDADTTKITPAEANALATIAAIDKNEIVVSVVASNEKVPSDTVDFAKMMIDQHGANLAQILQMAHSMHIPLANGAADKLCAQGKKDLLALGALQGDEFNKAYVNAMVSGHEAALKLIDTELMKTATNETVKKFMTDTRAAVVEHLEHAKKLQASLKA